eukprot:CAMPEP_0116884112 /NCGR_PEP_ID=MMETSP0463-20121206/16863_1 /TAXON_ID=181622 /ORGANISM="Strombidinopsis sp, Strain SopsisLIS2011" /LENGTH=84 /DNA_ID=CAMNT_0004540009 /DNA_START=226 /DNA_END=480 /DNA_ORIENTATION=-
MPVRDLNKLRRKSRAALEDTTIISKEFGQGDGKGKKSITWGNREKDWYNAERRLIFATAKQLTANKWVKLINTEKKRDDIKQEL